MVRPFLLSLFVVGVGAASVGEPAQTSDVATWRWEVSAILDAQRGDPAAANGAYDQRYERFESLGRPAAAPAER